MNRVQAVAIVTGGARGIGEAIGRALVQEGMTVVVGDREAKAGRRAAASLRRMGATALFIRTDVTRVGSVRRLVLRTIDAFGRIDVLVNNAAILKMKPVANMRPAEWEQVLAVNLTGPFLCAREVLPYLLRQRSGCIVNVASAVGKQSAPGLAAYGASKAGLIRFTESLAQEVVESGVRVAAVCPSLVRTAMARRFLRGRSPSTVLDPADVARVVAGLITGKIPAASGEAVDVRPAGMNASAAPRRAQDH